MKTALSEIGPRLWMRPGQVMTNLELNILSKRLTYLEEMIDVWDDKYRSESILLSQADEEIRRIQFRLEEGMKLNRRESIGLRLA